MTTVYFIRHAESDINVRDGLTRPLTEKGFADRRLVTEFLRDKEINAVLSSPYKRAVDTVSDFASSADLPIVTVGDFRERESDGIKLDDTDFYTFIKRLWDDFNYKPPSGECLSEVQDRNISALKDVLNKYKDKNIAIGTHGTALSTIINYYDNSYGYDDFRTMVNIMPWVVVMRFDNDECISITKVNVFNTKNKINMFYEEYYFLSNFYRCDITYEGENYANSESAYQAAKCADINLRVLFRNLTGGRAKHLGNEVERRADWEQVKLDVMREVVRIKFTENPDLAALLKDTGDAQITEGNTWHDNFYGNCTCSECANIEGQNHLGKILMELRAKL